MADAEDNASIFAGRQRGLGRGVGQIQRLFAKYVLVRRRGRGNLGAVQAVGGGDNDRVDLVIGQRGIEIGGQFKPVIIGEALRSGGIDIDDAPKAKMLTFIFAGKPSNNIPAPPAEPYHGRIDHERISPTRVFKISDAP
jgi:hypothetical protein